VKARIARPAIIAARAQRGATLVEVLVALLVTAFGLLGIAALQLRTYVSESESYQRAQAAMLLQDMVTRINANWPAADDYQVAGAGVGALEDCAEAAAGAPRDLCEWGNLLRGAAETSDAGASVGAIQSARGCVVRTAPNEYVISVVWQGTVPTGPADTACGEGEYTDENVRRAVTAIVRIPDLNA
jgi:type IV pilus assembly protein PilV